MLRLTTLRIIASLFDLVRVCIKRKELRDSINSRAAFETLHGPHGWLCRQAGGMPRIPNFWSHFRFARDSGAISTACPNSGEDPALRASDLRQSPSGMFERQMIVKCSSGKRAIIGRTVCISTRIVEHWMAVLERHTSPKASLSLSCLNFIFLSMSSVNCGPTKVPVYLFLSHNKRSLTLIMRGSHA